MSVQTLNAAFDDFDAWENELSTSRRRNRAARGTQRREAINRSLNVHRHRSREREV